VTSERLCVARESPRIKVFSGTRNARLCSPVICNNDGSLDFTLFLRDARVEPRFEKWAGGESLVEYVWSLPSNPFADALDGAPPLLRLLVVSIPLSSKRVADLLVLLSFPPGPAHRRLKHPAIEGLPHTLNNLRRKLVRRA